LGSEDTPPLFTSSGGRPGECGASPRQARGRWGIRWTLSRIALALSLLMIPSRCTLPIRRVRLVVNGIERTLYTPRTTVRDILEEARVVVYPEDIVNPTPEAEVTSGQTITLTRARWATVVADGQVHRLRTQADDVWELLEIMGIILRPQDRLLVNGRWVGPQASASAPSGPRMRHVTSRGPRPVGAPSLPASWHIAVVRAVPLHVSIQQAGEGQEETHRILSAAATVGEALYEAHIPLYRGDQVSPPPNSPLTAGMHVVIRRALPVMIQVDGQAIHTRTQGDTVADVLAQEKIPLWDLDYVIPSESSALNQDMLIRVVRVREEAIVEQEAIPFDTAWVPDSELELDQRRVEAAGQPGVIARRFRIHYEDGQVVTRTLEEEWRAQEPQSKVIAYGTKIVSRPIDTPDGPRSYWRKVRVLVTSYSAATSGKTRDHPLYGITRLGWQMRRGIIAVDPRVINFGTQIYVPGYGIGVSADTGGKILGRHIDLGYNETDLKLWYQWMDVYLLDPPPPRHQIRWILPNWPKER